VQVGKRGRTSDAAVSFLLLVAYSVAAWSRQPALLIFFTAPLLWRVPFERRWFHGRHWPPHVGRADADLPLLAASWSLATWALWQHRLLPLLVCAAAVGLLLAERSARRLAFARRAGIL
jgi:hypothetical protein